MARLKVLVNIHCGIGGHCRHESTESGVTTSFCWNGMKKDIIEFVRAGLRYIISRTGERIPWELSIALHGERLNDVVSLDFRYKKESISNDPTNSLLIKDELSSYTWPYLMRLQKAG